jgi:probable phosphoglycerate mutase
VVTHGRYLRVLLASVLDGYGLEQMHELGHANTCVNRLVHAGDSFRAELLNCTAHLDDAAA